MFGLLVRLPCPEYEYMVPSTSTSTNRVLNEYTIFTFAEYQCNRIHTSTKNKINSSMSVYTHSCIQVQWVYGQLSTLSIAICRDHSALY